MAYLRPSKNKKQKSNKSPIPVEPIVYDAEAEASADRIAKVFSPIFCKRYHSASKSIYLVSKK